MSEQSEAIYEPTKGGKRMPDSLRKFMLKMPGGKWYLPAAFRLVWFRDECPDWGVETFLIEGGEAAGFATVQAKVYNEQGRLISSGIKTESRKDFPQGHTEKAETGSIARALAVAGFATQASELDDPEHERQRPADSPQPIHGQALPRAAFGEGTHVVKEHPPQARPTGPTSTGKSPAWQAGNRSFYAICADKGIDTSNEDLKHHVASHFLNRQIGSMEEVEGSEFGKLNHDLQAAKTNYIQGLLLDFEQTRQVAHV